MLSVVDAQDPRAASGLICSQSATVQWRVAASFTRSQPVFTSRGICRAQSLPSTVLIRCVQSFRSATFPAWLFKASSFFLHLFDYRFHRALAAGTTATRMQTSVSAESVAWRRRPQVGIGTCAAAPWWPTWLTVTTVTILTCNKLTHVTWGAFDWSYSGIRIHKSFVLISSIVIFGYIWIFHFKQISRHCNAMNVKQTISSVYYIYSHSEIRSIEHALRRCPARMQGT